MSLRVDKTGKDRVTGNGWGGLPECFPLTSFVTLSTFWHACSGLTAVPTNYWKITTQNNWIGESFLPFCLFFKIKSSSSHNRNQISAVDTRIRNYGGN